MSPPDLVLLVQPPIRDFYLTRKRTIPYGLASVASALKALGAEVEIFDSLATDKSRTLPLPPEFSHLSAFFDRPDTTHFSLFHGFRHFGYSFEHIGNTVRGKKPFLVGISSLFTPYAEQALETSRIIKKFFPKAFVVLGGHHPTHFPEQSLACEAVDFILRGEGEIGLPLLYRTLTKKPDRDLPSDLKQIPGIGFQTSNGNFINPPAWMNDLSLYPLPLSSLISKGYYRRNKKSAISVVTSRGCPMPCSYCSVSSRSSHGRFRQRDVRDVLREIESQAYEEPIGFIDFEDENLTLDKGYFLTLLAGLNRIFPDRKPELRAMNGLFPPSLDRETVMAMKEAGFQVLNLSLGSIFREQLRRFHRPDVRAAHDQALDLAQEFGLSTVSYVIAGAPDQTASSSLEDLLYLARKKTLAGLSIFYPAPGSPDYELCRKKALLPLHFSLMRSTALPIDHSTTRLQSITLLRLARILNYMKSRVDSGRGWPRPRPSDGQTRVPPDLNREEISERLLGFFLHDGSVFGADREGNLYEHLVDRALSRTFLKKLQKTSVKGIWQPSKILKDTENAEP